MKKWQSRSISLVMVIAMLTSSGFSGASFGNRNNSDTLQNNTQVLKETPQRLLIKYKNDKKKVDYEKVKRNKKLKNIVVKETKKISKLEIVEVTGSTELNDIIDEIQKQDNVLYVQEDFKLFSVSDVEPFYYQQWGITNSGQDILGLKGKLNVDSYALESWSKSKGNAINPVAILDTGIDVNHEDLAANIYVNKGEIASNGVDDDKNGYIDDVNGWNFVDNNNIVYNQSEDMHGTHVAGIISAEENGKGIYGASPNTKVLPLKFIGKSGGYTSSAIEAISYAKNLGVKIVNCSWGSAQYNQALETEMSNSGLLFISAAGNKQTNNDEVPFYPASFNIPNVISVAALDNQGIISTFSNYGNSVDIAAPGTAIYSTLPDNKYGFLSGTSMAAPFVSAVASQLLDLNPDESVESIKNDLLNYSTHLDTLDGKVFNGISLNAFKAVNKSIEVTSRSAIDIKLNNDNNNVFSDYDEQKLKDTDFEIITNNLPDQLKIWENQKIKNDKYKPSEKNEPPTKPAEEIQSSANEPTSSISNSAFYKLKPKFLETNFNSYMSSATVTQGQNEFMNLGNFRTNKDLSGMSWYSADTISHPELRYLNDPSFENVKLTYNYSISGYTEPMDSISGNALTVETNNGEFYYVRLWNYVVNRPLEDWEIGASEYLDETIRFPQNRIDGSADGLSGRVEIDFNNLYAGWAPYQWVETYKGVNELGEPIIEGEWVSDPSWIKIPVTNIKRLMWTFVPQNYDFSSNQISFLDNSMPYEVSFTNWTVTGNAYLGEEPNDISNSSVGICDDYDDIYNLTPERVVSEYSKLGYKKNVDFYIGASHFYDKKYKDGVMQLIPDYAFNRAFTGWYKNYLGLLKDRGFNVVHSISMENLDAPWYWWQRAWDGSPSETGWTPATHLLSFTNPEVKAYYKKYVEALVEFSNEFSMTPTIQLGEPWWWYNESTSGSAPCFYDQATRDLYLSETGNYLYEFQSINNDITGHEEMLSWLGKKNGEFSLYLRDIVKQKDPASLFTVLFFPPSVLDKERVPLMVSLANFPKDQWKYPNLDFFMLEDYDYLITTQMNKHNETLEFISKNLGYPKDKIHYLSGFVLNSNYLDVWTNMEQALSDGFSHGFAENYIWAYSQVKRDGWHIPEIITASSPSGDYSNPIDITLTSQGNSNVYYTTDGQVPTIDNAIQYVEPIHISEDSTIKAAVMKNGILGNAVTFSYNFSLKEPICSDIVVDGKDGDWTKVSSNTIGAGKIFDLSVAQDETNLYLLTRGSEMNTDSNFYIDCDHKRTTGMNVWAWEQSGADYMIANSGLYKYTGTGSDWSWDYIEYVNVVKTSNIVEASVPLSLMNIFDAKDLSIGYGRNYSDFAPITGSKMAIATTAIQGENTYLNPGEEYLTYLLAETGATLQGNFVTYGDKVFELTSQNSRVVKDRIVVNTNEFANFITPQAQISSNLLALKPSGFDEIYLAALGDGGNESLSSDVFLGAASYGEYSTNVKRIQIALQKLGYWTNPNAKATGYFGEVTRQSLINFEKNNLQLTDAEINYINGDYEKGYTSGEIQTASLIDFKGIHEFVAAKLDELANGKKVTAISIVANYYLGIGDAGIETAKGIWTIVAHPVRTAEGLVFLVAASRQGTAENAMMTLVLATALKESWDKFNIGNANVKARYIGRLVGEIVLVVVSTKGVTQAIKAIKASAESGKLGNMLGDIGLGIKNGDDAVLMLNGVVDAIANLKNIFSNVNSKLYELFSSISKITKFNNYYEVITPDGLIIRIEKSEVSNISKIDEIAESAAKAESATSRGAFQSTDEIGDAIVDVDTVDDLLGNLDWNAIVSKKGESRIDHVNRHSIPKPNRVSHGVFNGNAEDMVNTAWSNRRSVTPVDDGIGGEVYNIPYTNAGYESGSMNTGEILNYITIITKKGTNEIIAAFPTNGVYPR